MTKSNGRPDILVDSTPDDVMLAQAVENKFLELSGDWLRIKGMEINIPESLDLEVLRWRQVRVRHKGGDYRHRLSEMKATKVIAQWTVDMVRELKNQKPEVIEWKED